MAKCIVGYDKRHKTRIKTHSSSEMLEYSRGETDGGGPGRLPRSGWVVVSAGVRLSDNDVWGTISSTAQHLEHTHTVTKGMNTNLYWRTGSTDY